MIEIGLNKSPQKEVLFKRMEGMKAVIKKRNVSYGGNVNGNSILGF